MMIMARQQSLRRALGALKDTTKVGLAKVNSDYKDLDIAIVKATNHVECPPKDRHVKSIYVATLPMRPRTDVIYCIEALGRRLAKTHNWTVSSWLSLPFFSGVVTETQYADLCINVCLHARISLCIDPHPPLGTDDVGGDVIEASPYYA